MRGRSGWSGSSNDLFLEGLGSIVPWTGVFSVGEF